MSTRDVSTDAPPPAAPNAIDELPETERPRQTGALLVLALIALLSIPLVIALVVVRQPKWFPLLDMAQTEIRIRDVASSHPPLIGLAGRIGVYGPDGGSHPGPLSFWALWPLYQAFGASSWAMQAGATVLNIVAIGASLWIARRRGGVLGLLGVALVLAVLMRAYGPSLLTLPWNPYLPLLWWFLFLLAVWSLFLDDLPMIPVAVFTGTIAMQTHVSYVGLIGGLGAVTAVVLVVRAVRASRRGESVRGFVRWGVAGLGLLVVLWIPPVIDEIVHEPGNLTVLRDYFGSPPEDPVGVREGAELFVQQLDPVRWARESLTADIRPDDVDGSLVPGFALLVVWALSAGVAAVRLRDRTCVALHTVIAIASVLGVVSAGRVFGIRFFYLFLWAWSLTALMLLAIGWTVALLLAPRFPAARSQRAGQAARAALAAATCAVVVVFAVGAADADVQAPNQNRSLGAIVEPTAARLAELEADGHDGPIFVTWFPDGWTIGAQGYGLLNELLRRDFDVRAHIANRPGSTRYHVLDPDDATIEVHVATGRDIQRWQTDSRYEEITYFDPRSDAERAEFEDLRTQVINELEAIGRDDFARAVDENLFSLGIEPEVPRAIRDRIARMIDLGMPTAVFLGPPSGTA